ncbi:hypothetical protein [Nonlabens marinus]|uniref:Secreted protein n=1 Tax=Nonlabens marinus S1-08 TaxID=1454201 RepID=W8VZJ9_9FLAO|nr:hypothetical protein [Nonlabens marinus]BAO54706.1 hypothetical protein NMS_0697 [Nonlabens marinus S1-08]
MRLFVITITFLISNIGLSQAGQLILLQDNDNYNLHVNYKCPNGSQYKIVRENKNPLVENGLLIYEFELDNGKTIHRDSLSNYDYQNIEDLDFDNPYQIHELICNNQRNLQVILKVQKNPDGRSRKRFDDSDKNKLIVYRARYIGTRYGY